MSVPFIDLKRQLAAVEDDVLADWSECIATGRFIGGPYVGRLEQVVADTLDVPHFVSCANGTDALIIALQASGVRIGSRVAIPNLTFWATYEAVVQLGARPVLLDIDPDDLQLDLDALIAAHQELELDAVVLVHLMGWCSARLAEFRSYCRDQGIPLIEDGAQSFGVAVNGQSLYSHAKVATLSFYPAKVLGGAMDGGGISTTSGDLARTVRVLTDHGRDGAHYTHAAVGWNSRMSELQAAFLLHMLGRADALLVDRRKAVARYRDLIKEQLGDRVRVYGAPTGVTENGYLLVVVSPAATGTDLAAGLADRGVGAANTYSVPIDMQPAARDAERFGSLDVSREFCRRVVNLPLFAGITDAEIQQSVDALAEVVDGLS